MGVTVEYQMSDSGASKFSALTGSSPCSLARSLALKAKTKAKPKSLHVPSDPSRALALQQLTTIVNSHSPLDHPSASIESLARG
jgi:hypothetical protein